MISFFGIGPCSDGVHGKNQSFSRTIGGGKGLFGNIMLKVSSMFLKLLKNDLKVFIWTDFIHFRSKDTKKRERGEIYFSLENQSCCSHENKKNM